MEETCETYFSYLFASKVHLEETKAHVKREDLAVVTRDGVDSALKQTDCRKSPENYGMKAGDLKAWGRFYLRAWLRD